MQSSYSFQLVVLSVVIACSASYAALYLSAHVAVTRARLPWFMASASAMGLGIWSMHFIAMLAYRLPIHVGYDIPLIALSLGIAILASGIGLEVAGRNKPSKARMLAAGPVMGLAIAGMHYVGMASMRLPATAHYSVPLVALSIAVAVAAAYAAIALFLRFRFDRTRRGFWLKVASSIVMGHAVAGMHYTAMAAVHFEHAAKPITGSHLPPSQLALVLALCTVIILALIVGGTIVNRWASTARAIRLSEERFRVMVDAIQDYAIFTVDPQARINSWNCGAVRLMGYSAEEILGAPLSRLYPEAEKDDAQREIAIASSTGRFESEGGRVTKDGAILRVHVVTSAMRDERGELLGFVRVIRDLTEKLRAEEELRRREEQLRQAQKMEAVGQLAGGVAHDFNNMLTAIRCNADVLLDDPVHGPEVRQPLLEIRRAAERSAALTGQLLAFSRKQLLQPRPMNPNTIVTEMESMLRCLLWGDVVLTTQLDPAVGRMTVDPAQLGQVLTNLVVNARDAMPVGGTIAIETANVDLDAAFCRTHSGAQPGPHVVLSVSDTGAGMSEEIRGHVFEPFFTTKGRGAGTGLGLSTVYGIVTQSGGHVWVDSELGQGTVFRIYFPLTTEALPVLDAPTAASSARESRETILLVDDETGVRDVINVILERKGYRVLTAGDGVEALDVSRAYEGTIHLLITDMMMPGMHGKELGRRLASQRPNVPVIYTSGYADDDIIERGLLDPRMTFIQKPFALSELTDKVRAALDADLATAG